jgi:hypothetical protein
MWASCLSRHPHSIMAKQNIDLVIDVLSRIGTTDPLAEARVNRVGLLLAGFNAWANNAGGREEFRALGKSVLESGDPARKLPTGALNWKAGDMRDTLSLSPLGARPAHQRAARGNESPRCRNHAPRNRLGAFVSYRSHEAH